MDISPISAVQVSPIHSDMVFMELLTRHAPVPQERNIIPTLPITEAFSFRLAFDTGSSFSASVKSCHGISM